MLLLLLLSDFGRIRLCATPWMAAHHIPLSLGFSRQEHWSGLPFPSPMHESEKWKWSHSVMSNSSQPHGLQPTRLLHPWDFPGKSTGVGCHCLLLKASQTGKGTEWIKSPFWSLSRRSVCTRPHSINYLRFSDCSQWYTGPAWCLQGPLTKHKHFNGWLS